MNTTTQEYTPTLTPQPGDGTIPARFEVTTLPVADVDRAKAFYRSLGWRLDIDFMPAPDTRGVQFTPPGSQASIQFGSGPRAASSGPLTGLLLIVDDIEAAREDLVRRGVDVGEIFHAVPGEGALPGVDPQHRSYTSRAIFSDPDGNQWQLQEVRERIPGRVEVTDSGAQAKLLLETALHHDAYEKVAPKHDWWDWYGAYMAAREQGSTPDEASAAAGRYMADVKNIVVA
jgi:catechol 2,3-dioxygenase-like lactoylglutathione lyase family enzyme